MRALVTGAAGFLGSHLVDACLERGWEVLAVDRRACRRNDPRCTALRRDVRDLGPADLGGIDVLFHLAARPGVRASWGAAFPSYVEDNVLALQALLDAAREARPRRVVFASSSSVYGHARGRPVAEDAPLRPLSPYAATKTMGEQLCRMAFERDGLEVVALRYFSLYGPRQRPDMAFHRAIAAALDGDPFVLHGGGRQTRDFTYVGDAVGATLAAAEHGVPGEAYNVGAGSRIALRDALELISRELGPIDVVEAPAAPGDARDTWADVGRAGAVLGYRPRTGIRDGLRRQVAEQAAARRARAGVPA